MPISVYMPIYIRIYMYIYPCTNIKYTYTPHTHTPVLQICICPTSLHLYAHMHTQTHTYRRRFVQCSMYLVPYCIGVSRATCASCALHARSIDSVESNGCSLDGGVVRTSASSELLSCGSVACCVYDIAGLLTSGVSLAAAHARSCYLLRCSVPPPALAFHNFSCGSLCFSLSIHAFVCLLISYLSTYLSIYLNLSTLLSIRP